MATVRSITHVVNWFEIPVRDLDRAVRFYEKAFDVKLSTEEMAGLKMAMFPFKQGAPGAAGSLVQGASYEPSHAGSVVYFTVEDIPEALRRITANGGRTLMPKTGIGEYGSIAQFEDTEGNRLALHSMK
jgi:uncharacterized protein